MSIDLQLKDYRLTTAEILYRMPDHLDLLQTFIWQLLDLPPRYPKLNKFLDYWEENIEGPIFSVRVNSVVIIQSPKMINVEHEFTLH